MSTITREFTKEQLQQIIETDHVQCGEASSLARIALASLEAEPAIHRWRRVTPEPYGPYPWHYGDFIGFSNHVEGLEDEYFYSTPPAPAPVSDEDKVLAEQARAVIHCLDMCGVPSGDYADNEQLQLWGRVIEYGRHPASVSVPDGYRLQPISEYDAMCAAMLQGADGTLTNEGTIPVTQFKPVADLYGLTSPTGGETSFTFDAVEARDFIDGGWSCQEYVELGRYQEALTDHSEDKLAMVDHSGDSNNMVEPVTTAYKLRDAVEIIRNSGIEIDSGKIQAERDSLNSPVIPDEVLSAIRKVARIRTDFDHFDGDRRGIGDCLDEAEQELIVTINKYASQLAAEPIATNDVREQQTAVPPIQADVAQAIENLKQKLVECNRYNYCADAVKNVEDACHAAMLQGSQPVSKREQVRREHAEWSDKTFGDVGPVGPLKHLSKEALEAAAEPDDLSEWADMQFLLWDAQRRAGISDGEITAAMEEKLKVNMARQWPEPKDGEPRQHLKPAPQTVPDSVISAAVNGIMATYADNAEDCREMVRTHVEQACRAAIQESGHG